MGTTDRAKTKAGSRTNLVFLWCGDTTGTEGYRWVKQPIVFATVYIVYIIKNRHDTRLYYYVLYRCINL